MTSPHDIDRRVPEGRTMKFVPHDHPLMQAAQAVRETLSGDPLFPVGAVLVRDGEVVARAGNGFNRGDCGPHVCPRVVHECPSGVGYDLCDLHDPPGHAEPMVIAAAGKEGVETAGCDLYMYGHWWCCAPCWEAMIAAGIRDVYVTDDSHERFSRDAVYAETLQATWNSVYISGALSALAPEERPAQYAFYEAAAALIEEMGGSAYVPHLHSEPDKHADMPASEVYTTDIAQVDANDVTIAFMNAPSTGVGQEIQRAQDVFEFTGVRKPVVLISQEGTHVSRMATGNPAVVYHLVYKDKEDMLRQLRHVLRQI